MATAELKVPSVGESITEVLIGDWLIGEGQAADKDAALVVIETDKVTVELPAPVSGTVTKVLKHKGDSAAVGEVIGYMETGAGVARSAAPAAAPAAAARATGAKLAAQPDAAVAQPAARPAAPTAAQQIPQQVPQPAPQPATRPAPRPATAPAPPAARESATPSAHVMPAARRALAERGLDATQVEASGPGGRLLKEDVERAVPHSPSPSATPAGAAPASRAPAAPAPAAPRPPAAASAGGSRHEELVPLTPMRKRIAERLVESQKSAALLTTFNEVDMGAVMELRAEHKQQFQERHGIKLGFMSFFVRAAVDALRLVPQVNAQIRGDHIVYHDYQDIGVAVGGGKGLVVPVLRNAERLSFAEIEASIADFAGRAQANRLTLEELQGGTFTISNGGIYGSLLSTPIVNPPQSGILGLHAIQERPVARDGQVVIRPMMYVALTYDHRLVDGREAVTFLKRIKECVEDPARMLLET